MMWWLAWRRSDDLSARSLRRRCDAEEKKKKQSEAEAGERRQEEEKESEGEDGGNVGDGRWHRRLASRVWFFLRATRNPKCKSAPMQNRIKVK